MKSRTQLDQRKPGITWTKATVSTLLLTLALASAALVSLVDYSSRTLEKNASTDYLWLESQRPLNLLLMENNLDAAYHAWIAGGPSADVLRISLAAFEADIAPIVERHGAATRQSSAKITEALSILREGLDEYGDKPRTEEEIVRLQSRFDQTLSNLGNGTFSLLSNDFSSFSVRLRAYFDDQFNRALRTIYLFVLLAISIVALIALTMREQRRVLAEARRLEQERADVSTQIRQAQESVADLKNLSPYESDYLSAVNHELRTPLTAIIGYIHMLRTISTANPVVDQEASNYLDAMERNSAVLLDTIEDILDMSKLESDHPDLKLAKVDVLAELQAMRDEQRAAFLDKNIKFNFVSEGGPYYILADRNQLRHVARNLASNALKYSPPGSQVTFSIERLEEAGANNVVVMTLSDEGIGIPADELPRIFSKFYRASNAQESQIKGTGLGLVIVKNIVERFGGTITAESSGGIGTTFQLTFPSYVDPAGTLIRKNRNGVLQRAIDALVESKTSDLIDVTHEHAGTLGFYDFEQESEALRDFSKWLELNSKGNDEITIEKLQRILHTLRSSLPEPDQKRIR